MSETQNTVEALSTEQVEALSWLSDTLKRVGVPEVNLGKTVGTVVAPSGAGTSVPTSPIDLGNVLLNGVKLEVAAVAFQKLDTNTLQLLYHAIETVLQARAT